MLRLQPVRSRLFIFSFKFLSVYIGPGFTYYCFLSFSNHWQHITTQTTFDWTTTTLHLLTNNGHTLLLPKGVKAFSIQVGVLQWGNDERESALTLCDPELVTDVAHLPKMLVVPMTAPIAPGSLALVSIQHYTLQGGEYCPVASKEGMYLEVIGVSG